MIDYKLVPVEPTPEWVANLRKIRIDRMESVIEDVLAAAPAVQGEPVAVLLIGEPEHTKQGWELGDWDIEPNATAIEAFAKLAEPGAYQLCLAPQPAEQQPAAKFKHGDPVRKIKGSQWKGRVVGTYSTELTPEGYAVESDTEKGSVQIYPAAALEMVTQDEQPVRGVADYEKVLDDQTRLTRELHVLLNGEEGAAHQASLADLVAQLSTVVRNTGKPVLAAPDVGGLVEALSGLLRSLCIHEGEDVVGRVKGTWSVEAEEEARAALAPYRKGAKP